MYKIKVTGINENNEYTEIAINNTAMSLLNSFSVNYIGRIMDNVFNKYLSTSPCQYVKGDPQLKECIVNIDGILLRDFQVKVFDHRGNDITSLVDESYHKHIKSTLELI